MHNVIAVIFDYDDTLVPDSTTQLLEYFKIDIKKFWKVDFKNLVEKLGFDPPLAYLNLILEYIGENEPFGLLTNKKLREIGAKIENTMYPGVNKLIPSLRDIVSKYKKKGLDVEIEFYIISGGLEEIIKGNKFIYENFRAIYGCRLFGESDEAELKYIKRIISFTEKTRYLFEINKGIAQCVSDKNPQIVNEQIDENKRRIPFRNMIYIGDGFSDIPCFSTIMKLSKKKGDIFGILHTKNSLSERLKVYQGLISTKRAHGFFKPEYDLDTSLGNSIALAVENNCAYFMKALDNPYLTESD